MKCPHCQTQVHHGLEYCVECGFSAAMLRSYLGDQWVRLERITDAAHCLRLEEIRRVEVLLDDFERALPQAFFAIYVGVLPAGLNVAELGFWLLNQGAFNTQQVTKRNDYGTVLVIDAASLQAGLTLGYAIEKFFPEKLLRKILDSTVRSLRQKHFGEVIRTLTCAVRQTLMRHARPGPWHPDTMMNTGIQVQPLRQGHRPVPAAPLPVHEHSAF
ncbi:MAG: hypothetical protein JNG86_21240 [Verrucomicrobiaceae bacterium]|nr:hypothetical protein [Verrucomicrobiaceae bacterium]